MHRLNLSWRWLMLCSRLAHAAAFGPDENDVAVLSDNKTLICVIRMDGDSGCSTNSYRYYAAMYSHDGETSLATLSPR